MNTFRILVADDHPVFRFGVCALLGTHEGWEICGEATDGREAVDQCRKMKPDLVILDICMPKLNGVDAARLILKKNPAQRILILTEVTSDQVIRDCLEAGVRGWVVKSDGVQGLTSAVEALQRHSSVFSPRVSDLMMDGYRQQRIATPTPRAAIVTSGARGRATPGRGQDYQGSCCGPERNDQDGRNTPQ